MYEVMKRIADTDDEVGAFAKDFLKAAKLKAGFDFPFGRRPGGWPPGGREDRDGRGERGPDRNRGPNPDGPPPNFREGGPRFGEDRGGRPDGPGREGSEFRGFRQRDGGSDSPQNDAPRDDGPRPPA
jgi:hypothetical protein